MSIGVSFIFFGILLIITPLTLAIKAGVKSNEDMIQWMMDQPLDKIMMLRFLNMSGLMFLGIGGVVYYTGV